MADVLYILGQSAPSATTETDLYEVPSSSYATISSLIVCNRGGAGGSYRISVSAAGAATANKDYLFYDTSIGANSTDKHVIGMTLAETDVVRVYASSGNFSFNIFGVETS